MIEAISGCLTKAECKSAFTQPGQDKYNPIHNLRGCPTRGLQQYPASPSEDFSKNKYSVFSATNLVIFLAPTNFPSAHRTGRKRQTGSPNETGAPRE